MKKREIWAISIAVFVLIFFVFLFSFNFSGNAIIKFQKSGEKETTLKIPSASEIFETDKYGGDYFCGDVNAKATAKAICGKKGMALKSYKTGRKPAGSKCVFAIKPRANLEISDRAGKKMEIKEIKIEDFLKESDTSKRIIKEATCIIPKKSVMQTPTSLNRGSLITSNCNYNGICESGNGENIRTCYNDCNFVGVCYQESPDYGYSLDSRCGLSSLGTYSQSPSNMKFVNYRAIFDGDWETNSTMGPPNGGNYNGLAIKYIIPQNTASAVWHIKDGRGWKDFKIPSSCLNGLELKLEIFTIYSGSSFNTKLSCGDNPASRYVLDSYISYYPQQIQIYEEAVTWRIGCQTGGSRAETVSTVSATLNIPDYGDNYFCGNMSYDDVKRTADFICQMKLGQENTYSNAVGFAITPVSPSDNTPCAFKSFADSPNYGLIGNAQGTSLNAFRISRVRCCVRNCSLNSECGNSNYACNLGEDCWTKDCNSDNECYYNLDWQYSSELNCENNFCDWTVQEQNDCSANPWNGGGDISWENFPVFNSSELFCDELECSANSDCTPYDYSGRPPWTCQKYDPSDSEKYCMRNYCISDNQCNDGNDGWGCVLINGPPSYRECDKTCSLNSDCRKDYYCTDEWSRRKICAFGCEDSSNCDVGKVCISDGSFSMCEKTCINDWDCPPYQRCNQDSFGNFICM